MKKYFLAALATGLFLQSYAMTTSRVKTATEDAVAAQASENSLFINAIRRAILEMEAKERLAQENPTVSASIQKPDAGLTAIRQDHLEPQPTETINLLRAFMSLYGYAEVVGKGVFAPNSGEKFANLTEAEQVFFGACPNKRCDYVRGKLVKVDFSQYPELDTYRYNKQYGEQTAEAVLRSESYNTKNASVKLVSDNPCSLFTQEYVDKMPAALREELARKIWECSEEAKAQEKAPGTEPREKLNNCHANVTFAFEPSTLVHVFNLTCADAARVMENQKQPNTSCEPKIVQMRVCGNTTDSSEPKCHMFDILGVADAQKFLNLVNGDK